ncbi:hypothetical protein [Bombella apis]|uniref:hypothetical protein n=1 Tax=Bombella apis TaxID=1785988 RepID=UPI0023F3D7C8|nr:hypothetical protein [Bombella apis]MCT6844803.1 hypothetical protein [Bombella apis]
MTTAIDLCRRALMRLGTQSGITAFDDGSVEASVCAAYYDDVLLGLLAHPASFGGPAYTWQWPRCVGTGTAVASDSPLWRYEILMPEDSVRVLRVDDGKTVRPVDQRMKMFDRRDSFGEGMGKAGGTVLRPVILTDSQTVSVTYITRNVDIDYWPAAFRRAFWLCLASAIATTLNMIMKGQGMPDRFASAPMKNRFFSECHLGPAYVSYRPYRFMVESERSTCLRAKQSQAFHAGRPCRSKTSSAPPSDGSPSLAVSPNIACEAALCLMEFSPAGRWQP